jgi:predicted phosphodiesterase
MSQKRDPNKLAEFLSRPRTIPEIAAELGLKTLNAKKVWSLRLPDQVDLFEQKNELDHSVFVVVGHKPPPELEDPIWRHWLSPQHFPYLWIQLPPDYNHPRVRIIPLSDVHYGAKAHSEKRFREYLSWIASKPDVFVFLNGDILENAIDGSIGGAVYESILTPDEQIYGKRDGSALGMIELLRPIAHKILWAHPGNHEWRTKKKTDIDLVKIICRDLRIPYFDEPIYADVLCWGQRFTFFCHHGKTGSATKGGKMNAASRPGEFQEAVDFMVMGHVHDSMANPITRIVRKREYDENGKLVSFKLLERPQFTVICPSFYDYFNNYSARAGYAPGSWGTVTCTLFEDGTYRASE